MVATSLLKLECLAPEFTIYNSICIGICAVASGMNKVYPVYILLTLTAEDEGQG